jgi:predicted nucleic acid-binding protein
MKPFVALALITFVFLITSPDDVLGGKKKKKKSKKSSDNAATKMFDSKTLKCLVCQSVIDELETAIYKIDPKKMVDTGTFRVNEKGEQKRSVVSVITT